MVKAAVVQIDPHLADKEHNLRLVEEQLVRAAEEDAALAVFPECAVSGYVFESLEEALEVAEPVPGPATERIAAAAAGTGLYAIVGLLERVGDRCFNTAIVVGPTGLEAVYRKTHTLYLGVDRFTTPGDIPYRVLDLPVGRVGVLICYDLRFPETVRALALQGAQIVALPTNWPQASSIQADVFTRARAAENRVFVLAADRVGQERGAHFLGRSQIVAPSGAVLAEASHDRSEMLLGDVDPAEADEKRVVIRAGVHEMDFFADRRPELYGELVRDVRLAEVG
jgi:predicted amidohydrolase